MKKISVITLHRVKNYGSVLQTYATQVVFEKLGCTVTFVDFWRKDLIDDKLLRNAPTASHMWNKNFVTRMIYKLARRITTLKKIKVFNSFINDNIKITQQRYYSIDELQQNPPEADVYCTGSDQTWNSDYNGGILTPYFLEYAPEKKPCIAYSASFGKNDLDNWEVEDTKKLLQKYSAISTREKSGVDILQNLGLEGIQLLDPSLALSLDEWKTIISKPLFYKKYMLIYQLNKSKDFDLYVEKIAKKKGIPLIRIGVYPGQVLQPGKMIYIPSVEDFLSLFYYAEFVITDSFHGTAFSINFNKKFAVIYPPKYSTRLQSILQLTGLENHVVRDYNDFSCFDKEIDYQKVNTILKEERNKVKVFLLEALNLKIEN